MNQLTGESQELQTRTRQLKILGLYCLTACNISLRTSAITFQHQFTNAKYRRRTSHDIKLAIDGRHLLLDIADSVLDIADPVLEIGRPVVEAAYLSSKCFEVGVEVGNFLVDNWRSYI